VAWLLKSRGIAMLAYTVINNTEFTIGMPVAFQIFAKVGSHERG
jgi:hypothetical protein